MEKELRIRPINDSYLEYEKLGYFYDIKNGICIYKMFIKTDLKVGWAYSFNYEIDDELEDVRDYVILKKEGYVYYMAEYIDKKLYKSRISCLNATWVKCDVKETLGIDLDVWENKEIYEFIMKLTV